MNKSKQTKQQKKTNVIGSIPYYAYTVCSVLTSYNRLMFIKTQKKNPKVLNFKRLNNNNNKKKRKYVRMEAGQVVTLCIE